MNQPDDTSSDSLETLAERVAAAMRNADRHVGTAESCTGGWVAKCLTDISGSSTWFERGLVTYSNRAKEELLGVSPDLLATHGAVSGQVAEAMVRGLLQHTGVDTGVAITGIAGPGGGSAEKPVGLVWLAWQVDEEPAMVHSMQFEGDRHAVRTDAVRAALRGLLALMEARST